MITSSVTRHVPGAPARPIPAHPPSTVTRAAQRLVESGLVTRVADRRDRRRRVLRLTTTGAHLLERAAAPRGETIGRIVERLTDRGCALVADVSVFAGAVRAGSRPVEPSPCSPAALVGRASAASSVAPQRNITNNPGPRF